MRKLIVFLVAISFLIPAMAFSAQTWDISGRIKNVKVYGDDESHGYKGRIDVKLSDGKLKKIYIHKTTIVVDAQGKKLAKKKLQENKNVQVNYKKGKNGDDLVAIKVTIL